MEMNPTTIPATQTELAKRATCSRGTLRNRVWPLKRLRAIKMQRLKQVNTVGPKRITLAHRVAVEVHIEDKKRLMEQLNKSRSEAARLVDECLSLKSEHQKMARAAGVLGRAKEALVVRVMQLEKRLTELEEKLLSERARNVVVPFPKASAAPATKRKRQKESYKG
jgi:DNA-binding Lrp family transcriptional regulator